MKQFRCTKCRFEFNNREKSNTIAPRRCPYCAAEGSVEKKKHVLDELD